MTGVLKNLLLSLLLFCVIERCEGGLIINATETSGDVVFSGSGTLNLSALSFSSSGGVEGSQLIPFNSLVLGPTPPIPGTTIAIDEYHGITTTPSFGSFGPLVFADSGTGDTFGFSSFRLFVPAGYISESELVATTTFSDATFESLNINPGTYVYEWGMGNEFDSITLNIGDTQGSDPSNPVPEPSSTLLFGLGSLCLLTFRRRRRDDVTLAT